MEAIYQLIVLLCLIFFASLPREILADDWTQASSGAYIAVYIVVFIIVLIIIIGTIIFFVYCLCCQQQARASSADAENPRQMLIIERRERLERAIDSRDKNWIREALAEYEDSKKGGRPSVEDDGIAERARQELKRGNAFSGRGSATDFLEGKSGGKFNDLSSARGTRKVSKVEPIGLTAGGFAAGAAAGGAGAAASGAGAGAGAPTDGNVGSPSNLNSGPAPEGYGFGAGKDGGSGFMVIAAVAARENGKKTAKQEKDGKKPFNEKDYQKRRQAVIKATDGNSLSELERAMRDYCEVVGSDPACRGQLSKEDVEVINNGQKGIEYLKLRDKIYRAMGQQAPGGDKQPTGEMPHASQMEEVLKQAALPENAALAAMLGPDLEKLKKKYEEEEERAKKADGPVGPSLRLNGDILRILAQIVAPSKPLHCVVIAFFLLFNEKEDDVKDWKVCREVLLAMAESDTRRVHRLRVPDLFPDITRKSKEYLAKYEPKDVHLAAAETDAIYRWTKRVLEAFDEGENLTVMLPRDVIDT